MKAIGYILAIIGIVLFAIGMVAEARTFVSATLNLNISNINDLIFIIAGAALILIGLFLAVKSKGRGKYRSAEVPIYQGKNIVGYRRH